MNLKRTWLTTARLFLVATAAAMTGCVSDAQFTDFLRTEAARVAADVMGQLFLILMNSVVVPPLVGG